MDSPIGKESSRMATTPPSPDAVPVQTIPRAFDKAAWLFFAIGLGATLLLTSTWIQLIHDAINDKLHAYAIAIPFISAWLVWRNRANPAEAGDRSQPSIASGVILGIVGVVVFGIGAWAVKRGLIVTEDSRTSVETLAWVLAIWAAAVGCFGWSTVRRHLFPLAFLAFTIPLPTPAVDAFEIALQRSSASAVGLAFQGLGVTHFRDDRAFVLPGLTFVVAQECSGIRSTLVLFIVSLLAGQLILRSNWCRAALTLSVLPLGIARNTLRIVTIALLSVHVDPRIIDSPLHHQGGPLFFSVSLIPFFLLLWWLRRSQRRKEDRLHTGLVEKEPAECGNAR